MIGNCFVIDSVVHAYNLTPENQLVQPVSGALSEMIYAMHLGCQPRGVTKYVLDRKRYYYALDPEFLAHAMFAESQTDVVIYHSIPLWGFYADGLSPLWVGKAMRDLYPGRVLLFGGVSPWQKNALEEVDRLIEEDGVVGIKLYPEDIVDGQVKPWRADDPKVAFPLYERAQKKGIRTIALHKAQPLGPVPMEPFTVGDVQEAALAFPDLHFEIVHGGYAFLEETAMHVARFPNVCINLEGSSGLLANAPRKFAEILGTFMAVGGRDRLIWATGAMLYHPQPYLQAFWNFQMPRDLVEDYGFPEVTEDDKRAILGLNQARLLGLNIEDLKLRIADDAFGGREELAEPWSGTYTASPRATGAQVR